MKKDPDIVPKETPLIICYGKSYICVAKSGKDDIYTSHISRRVNFVRNGEKWKIHDIDWYEKGLQF